MQFGISLGQNDSKFTQYKKRAWRMSSCMADKSLTTKENLYNLCHLRTKKIVTYLQKMWSTLSTYNYKICHLYSLPMLQLIHFLCYCHCHQCSVASYKKGAACLVPCCVLLWVHAILSQASACWHMHSGIGRLYMDSCGFLNPKPLVSLWRRMSCMWCLNRSHLHTEWNLGLLLNQLMIMKRIAQILQNWPLQVFEIKSIE